MAESFEYAIKKDVRNNPIVREVDQARQRELWKSLGIAVFLVAAFEVRLVYLQVFQHADLVARAERQQLRTIPAPSKRGDILDRRGRVLATSVDADSIYAVPTEIDQPALAAKRICEALRDCAP